MPRKKNDKRDTTVCQNFCRYYKPGKNEELACQGFVVVHRLLGQGRRLSQEKPLASAKPDAPTIEGLKKRLCDACSFHDGDCDFVLSSGTASPCGGYLLLYHLLGSGDVKLEELEEI